MKHVARWAGVCAISVVAVTQSGCARFDLSDADLLNAPLWQGSVTVLPVRPGTIIAVNASTQDRKGQNVHVPAATSISWQRPNKGDYQRKDLLFLRWLLASSRPTRPDGEVNPDKVLDVLVNDSTGAGIMDGVFDTLKVVYETSMGCRPFYDHAKQGPILQFGFPKPQDTRVVAFDPGPKLAGDTGVESLSEKNVWYSQAKNGLLRGDVRPLVPIKIAGQLLPLHVSPCLTVDGLEQRLGGARVTSLRRSTEMWPDVPTLPKERLVAADGYVSMTFDTGAGALVHRGG